METETQEQILPPEVFISYSWTDAEYIQWVREFAEELQENNVKVHLDQWSLREGDDKYVYMEKMVTDHQISKVLILCDREYQKKADDRTGGVGTETTIITSEIYNQVKSAEGSQKFIPVITRRDPETEKEFMPAFIKSRMYIDFSNENRRAERMEQLIRLIYNKPQYTPPPLGKIPSYIIEESKTNIGTSSRQRRAIELIKNEKPQALNATKEYFETVTENLKELDITEINEVTTDQVIERIKDTLPIRDEIVEVFEVIARYCSGSDFYVVIHDFFESLIPYLEPSRSMGRYNKWQADHYKFFLNELFLYSVASLLKHQRFTELNEITVHQYYVSEENHSRNAGLNNYRIFNSHSEALKYYNERADQKYYSIHAKFLNDRASRTDIKFRDLMQSDFFLFVLSTLQDNSEESFFFSNWYPDTLSFGEMMQKPFEVFIRSESKQFFERLRVSLGNATKEDLENLMEKFNEKKQAPVSGLGFYPNLEYFMGISNIATRP